jgi:hypothetical protein
MSAKLGSGVFEHFWSRRLLIWPAPLLVALVAGWLMVGDCTVASAQQSMAKAKVGAPNSDAQNPPETSCTAEAESPALSIDGAKTASEGESHRSLSEEGDEAQPLKKLAVESHAHEDWMKDQIGEEKVDGAAESRSEAVAASPASEQKCTQSAKPPKPKLERAN